MDSLMQEASSYGTSFQVSPYRSWIGPSPGDEAGWVVLQAWTAPGRPRPTRENVVFVDTHWLGSNECILLKRLDYLSSAKSAVVNRRPDRRITDRPADN